MRKFSFSLKFLLLIVFFFAFAVWWTIWPRMRAEKFVRLLSNDPIAARAMSGQSELWSFVEFKCGKPYYEIQHRTIVDTILGKQEFTVYMPSTLRRGEEGFAEFYGTLLVSKGIVYGPFSINTRLESSKVSKRKREQVEKVP